MEESRAFNRDCMEAMKEFPDGFFDLAVVDPPYGIGADNFKNGAGASKDGGKLYSTAVKMKNRLNQGGGKLKNRALNTSDTSWDVAPPPEYFDELRRVSKNQIILPCCLQKLFCRAVVYAYLFPLWGDSERSLKIVFCYPA